MLDENKRTSLFKLKQALLKLGKEQDEIQGIEDICPMPIPAPLKISTITFCYNIGTVNYLNIISRYIPIYDIKSPEVLSNYGQITYAKQIYSLPRGWTDKKPKAKKHKHPNCEDDEEDEELTTNTRFPNQVTLNFRYCGLRNISIMIFSNGAIKMAGLLSQAEGEWVSKRVTEIIKNIKINVYDSYGQLPKENNHINDFSMVINNKNQIRTYRWVTTDDYTSWLPTDTMMPEIIEKIGAGLVPNIYWHGVDVNFSKLCYINKIKEYIENGVINVSMLNKQIPLPRLVCLQEPEKASVNNLKICMINSDFSFFFYIKSNVLRDLLTDKYHVDSSYGVQGYNAVKSQYKWNPQYTNSNYPGMCQCSTLCFTKTKSKNKCKIITISVFQNGNAIITGATDLNQLQEAHKFIVKIVRDNYNELQKKEPYTSRKKVVSGRTNIKNKKRTVILLKKKYIDNITSALPAVNIDYDSNDEDDDDEDEDNDDNNNNNDDDDDDDDTEDEDTEDEDNDNYN